MEKKLKKLKKLWMAKEICSIILSMIKVNNVIVKSSIVVFIVGTLLSSCMSIDYGMARQGADVLHLTKPSAIRPENTISETSIIGDFSMPPTANEQDNNYSIDLGLQLAHASKAFSNDSGFCLDMYQAIGASLYYGKYINNSMIKYDSMLDFFGAEIAVRAGAQMTFFNLFYLDIGLYTLLRAETGEYSQTVYKMFKNGDINSYNDRFYQLLLPSAHYEFGIYYHGSDCIAVFLTTGPSVFHAKSMEEFRNISYLSVFYGFQLSAGPWDFSTSIHTVDPFYNMETWHPSIQINYRF
jgi:hypothetical protein